MLDESEMHFVANSNELGLRAAVCCVLLSIQYTALLFAFLCLLGAVGRSGVYVS